MSTLSEALAPRSDQLNADDLIPGPRVLKITGGRIAKDGRETRLILSYEGDNGKPFKPCKTMGRAMVVAWALTDDGFAEQIKGKAIRVYRDPDVSFGDQRQIGGIRISHMSHIDKPVRVKLTVSQGKKSEFVFHPLATEAPREQPQQSAGADVIGWVDTLIGRINAAPDRAAVDAILNDGVVIKRRGWMKTAHPDLAARIDDAVLSYGMPNDGTYDPQTNPTAAEGRGGEDRGEGFFAGQGGE